MRNIIITFIRMKYDSQACHFADWSKHTTWELINVLFENTHK